LGRAASTFFGAAIGGLLAFIFLDITNLKAHPVYFLINAVGLGYLGYRYSGFVYRKVEAKKLNGIEIEQTDESDEHVLYQPVKNYSEMSGFGKLVFDCSLGFSWLARAGLYCGVAYAVIGWLLPPNATDIPISDWTLNLIARYLLSVWVISATVFFWYSLSPTTGDSSSWENHPYEGTWTLVWGLFSIGFLYYFWFIR